MVTMPTRPTTTPPGPWSFPSSQRFTLDNGLRVIVHDLPGQYVVSAGLMLDVPLTSEPEDLEGVALLTASTLSEGTHDHPGTSFTEAVESCGAVLDAAVGQSHAHVLVDVPGARLPEAMALLAEAITQPHGIDHCVEPRLVIVDISEIHGQRDVLECCQRRDQVVRLKDEADLLPPKFGE